MEYAAAVKQLKSSKYEVKEYSESACEIVTGVVGKGCEGIPLLLFEESWGARLTDCAEVANGVGDFLSEDELRSLARLFGFFTDDWHIEKDYEGLEDIENFRNLVESIFPQKF